MAARTIATETVAEGYLALLRARGIEHLYCNAGTDFAPLIEAYARLGERAGALFPRPVLAAHEGLAMGMAHGAWLASGRPQAVMFHTSVGTANALCGAINASRDRAPILITAGRTPLFEQGALGARDLPIHWAQEMFDQAGMLRELVKWDYELRDGRQLTAVLDRALSLALAEPRGPVYLTLPREVLAAPLSSLVFDDRLVVPAPPAAAEREIDVLAERLARAELPLVVAGASGIDAAAVPALEDLAARFAIGVVEDSSRCLNVSADCPTHLGYQLLPLLGEADVLCFLEVDVPWIPAHGAPRADAFVAHAGVDPLCARYPMRSHRADLALTGTAAGVLTALSRALGERERSIDSARGERLRRRSRERRERAAAAAAAERARSGPITKAFLNLALGDALPREAVLVNEYWGSPEALARTAPRSYFYLSTAGGLGWGLPAALGVRLAAPGRPVVAAVGDGAYLFANPVACHLAAAALALPVLTVVCNNRRWGAVDAAVARAYPAGAAVRGGGDLLSLLLPEAALERSVEASGGVGIRVSERADLAQALARGQGEVAGGRQVVLNVICAD